MNYMIQVKKVSKKYYNQIVLDSINLEIKKGAFVSILGPSGSGKSTLLNILSGNDIADSGDVLIENENIMKYSESKLADFRKSTIGFVYQFFNLLDELSVYDNIMLPMYLKRKKIDPEYFNELIKDLNIVHLLNKPVHQLSGGEMQRVAIARSMIYQPKILMLDEPTGNLDKKNRNNIMELLKKMNEKYQLTIIQVTHDLETIHYSNEIITIEDGKIKEKL